MKKTLLSIFIVLILLLVVICVTLSIFISPIIKTGIETLGPQITQVSIKLDGVDVSVFSGTFKIKGLVVGNPSGYKSPNAIKLRTASVSLDPFSVFSNKILIHSIHVESPEITYEGGLSGSNLTKIMDNVNAVARKGGPAESDNANKPAPKIEVDDFLITHGKIRMGLKIISGNDIALALPDIHLTNLGKENNGITPTELIRTVLTQVTTATVKAVTSSITNSTKVIKGLGKELNTITKGLGGFLKD